MKKIKLIPFVLLIMIGSVSRAQLPIGEKIDRGVVALSISETEVYVGWRSLKEDSPETTFNIYRKDVGYTGFEKVNSEPVKLTTDYLDRSVKPGHGYYYRVKKVVQGKETDCPGEAYVFTLSDNKPYLSIKLNEQIKAKRIGIGDLDGDGAYDFVIQHPD